MHSLISLPVKSLKPYKKNSRKHSDEQIRAIADSIAKFGFNAPVLVWGNKNEIVAGHARCQAAALLGMKEVPCVRIDHLSEAEKRAYLIADNKLQEQSEWDHPLLVAELTDLANLDFDISITGFDMDFLGTAIIEDDEKNRQDPEIIGSDDRKSEHDKPQAEFVSQYGVIVVCKDEEHQKEIFERLASEGLEVKVVVT